MTPNVNSCAILVPSCDAYSDLWRPFFTLFFRYWPDCPYKIYLGSNTLNYESDRVTVLKSAHGAKWAERTADHLAQMPEPHVIFWLEDFFLRRPVDTGAVAKAYASFQALEACMFRLVRRPGPSAVTHEYFGAIDPGTPYRVSTQAAFWKTSILRELIVPGETIWQFEHAGSDRSSRYPEGFFAVSRDILPYRHHVVERGEWFPWEAWKFGRMNIGCDFQKRRVMRSRTAARWLARKAKDIVLEPVPPGIRGKLRQLVRGK